MPSSKLEIKILNTVAVSMVLIEINYAALKESGHNIKYNKKKTRFLWH